MTKKLLLSLLLCAIISNIYSQQVWTKDYSSFYQKKTADNPKIQQSLKLEKELFLSLIKNAPNRNQLRYSSQKISLPVNHKGFELFEFFETSNFSQELAAKYPSIKSFTAKSLTSGAVARFSYSETAGLHAFINTNKGTYIVKPTDIKTNSYSSYNRNDITSSSDFECNTIEKVKENFNLNRVSQNNLNDNYLRKYRLALAVTGGYSNFFLTGNETTDQERKAVVLSAINNTLTRINGIFEKDFGVTMELIPNNDDLIYLDDNTDPFSNRYNTELQSTLSSTIGESNYDVGHLFVHHPRRHGNAGCIACVCTDDSKGSAFSAQSDLDTDSFNLLASHEFGHQFGGYHVQSSSNCRSSAGLQEVEPGSGSSIMGYAGICPPNVQENADDYFNYVDIRDVIEWTRNNSSCAELIITNNTAPTVNAGNDYTIPKSTPFILDGSGNDIDNSELLTYCWEQNDPENPSSSNTPQPNWQQGPLFRSRLPVNSPVRYIPQLEDVIQGNLTPTWEVLPSVSRPINFVLTARDNALIGAKTASDQMTINVDDTAGPFLVSSQNSIENWNVGDSKTITWDVANTNLPPVNATNVEILLSTDGGYTYPYVIISSTPNDGTAEVSIPGISESTTQGRIMVKPLNNIFYAINSSDINIQTSEFAMFFTETNKSVCIPNTIEYTFNYKTYLSFNETTTFSVENLPSNLTATFDPTFATNNNTPVKLTISNTINAPIGVTNFNAVGTATSTHKKTAITFNAFENNLIKPVLNTPVNNTTNVDTTVSLNWNSDNNIDTYTLEIATDSGFNTILNTVTTDKSDYTLNPLNLNTTYFWRVKGENTCNESQYSNIFSFTTKCNAPNSITTNNITTNSVDITWVDNNSQQWEIEVVPNGATPIDSGITVLTNPFTTIPNLESGTSYDIYVRSLCSPNNYSDWIGPKTFTTLADFCNGDRFYDSGGANGSYSNNENITTTILPSAGSDLISVTFNSFQTEGCCDQLAIYDGNDINAPLIGIYKGNNSPGTIYSKKDKGLTFLFTSDSSITQSGWDASVECITITCPEPNDFSYSIISGNSVDLNWTSNGSETKWEIEYGNKGFTKGLGTKFLTTTNPVNINTLSPETEYDFYITAICGTAPSDDDSFVVGPISFKTPCNIINAPYTYDIEQQNTNSIIENCWVGTPIVNDTNYYWEAQYSTYNNNLSTGPYKSNNGDKYFRTPPFKTSNIGDEANLLSPIINISSLNEPVLNFYSFMYGENTGSLHVDVFNNGEWTNDVFTLEGSQQFSHKDEWSEHFIDLSNFSNTVQIRFRAISGGGYNTTEIDIDDISIIDKPTCVKSTNIKVNTITNNSANIDWVVNGIENEWIIEYGVKDFVIGTGTQITTTTKPYSLKNLESNTNYDFYLKSNCSSSNWNGPYTIKTLLDFCNGDRFYDSGGADGSYSDNENVITTIVPSEDFDQISVTFNTFQTESCCDVLYIYDGPDINATLIGGFRGSNSPGTITSTHSSGSLTFKFVSDGSVTSSGWDASITCETTCPKPSDITINDITQNTANISWTTIEPESNCIIEYGEKGFLLGTGTIANSNTNSYSITNLNTSTEYDVYIKTDCGNKFSKISAPITFKTNCPTPTNTFISNITHSNADLNWTPQGNENSWFIEYGIKGFTLGTGTIIETNSTSYNIINLNASTEYEVYIKANCGNGISEPSTPVLFKTICPTPTNAFISNITHNNADLDWTPQGNENSWVIEYGIKGFTLGTGTIIETNSISYSVINLNASTEYEVYIKANCGNGISEPSTPVLFKTICPIPTDSFVSNITQNTADLNWTPQGSENSWIIEYGIKGFTLGTGTIIETESRPYKITNLTLGTEYDIYVKSVCNNTSENNTSEWTEPLSFETCNILKAPFYENFASTSIPNCWIEYGSKKWNFSTGADHEAATAGDFSPNSKTNYAWINGTSPNSDEQISYLKTILVDISDLRIPAIQFSVFSKNTINNIYNNLKIKLHDSTGKSFDLLDLKKQTINGWQVFTFNINDYPIDSNEIQLEFIVTENNATSQFNNDILFDDLKIDDLEKLESDNNPIFYPNPVKNKLVIKSHGVLTKIEVFNLLRQRLRHIKLNKNKSVNEIDLTNLSNGIYLIKTYSKGSKPKVFKIIKN
ncbi:fibronectin type III domain-containing protein [Tenacibaculum ovolyticum]|uniref:fibronectin type III domain-containing protein n=1 Tax=Tenacibaculum ovolyticum TaxID=104270 RepID=UPI001EEF4802|nr:fibronectin type III domain-containing protein [Tenacibaculum ovolyticum]